MASADDYVAAPLITLADGDREAGSRAYERAYRALASKQDAVALEEIGDRVRHAAQALFRMSAA